MLSARECTCCICVSRVPRRRVTRLARGHAWTSPTEQGSTMSHAAFLREQLLESSDGIIGRAEHMDERHEENSQHVRAKNKDMEKLHVAALINHLYVFDFSAVATLVSPFSRLVSGCPLGARMILSTHSLIVLRCHNIYVVRSVQEKSVESARLALGGGLPHNSALLKGVQEERKHKKRCMM